MYKINELPGYIGLGNLNEKGVCEIAVDVSAWVALYPTGTFAITYMRPSETDVYPVAAGDIVVADGILTWTVSDTVTATAGSGSMVIQCAVGDTIVKKSPLIQTVIGAGHKPAGEAPDPVADWVEDATSKLAEVDPALGLAAAATLAANTAATLASEKAAIAAQAATDADNAHIVSAEFVDDDIVLTTQGADEIILAGAATTLKGDTGNFNMRGDYNPDADPLYSLFDLVSDGGGSFVYIYDTPSNEPTSSASHWQQIAEKGDTGPSAYDAAVAGEYTGTEEEFNAANAGIEAAKDAALGAAETANEAAENAETAAYRSMLWRKAASGNPVSVYPVPESPLYPKISGTFTQAGTGDPSPENIRPITPWLASGGTSKVKRTGKNLFAENLVLVATTAWRTKDSAVYKVDSNKPTYIQANVDELSRLQVYLYDNAMQPITLHPSLVFDVNSYIGLYSSNVNYSIPFSLISGELYSVAADVKESKSVLKTKPSAGVGYVKLRISSGGTSTPRTITCSNVLISNETDVYEPYSGQEITLTAPQEIPAGWMDNEGNGQITHGYIASYVDETVQDGWVSSIGELSAGAQVVYPLATPIDITPTAAPLTALPQLDRITPRVNVLTASTGNVELAYAKSPIQESNDIATAIAAL